MALVDVFIETSSLPRGINHLSPELERLIELVKANLVRIHMSEITFREWESQMINEFLKVVKPVSQSIKTLLRQNISSGLSCHSSLEQLENQSDEIQLNATEVAKNKVKEVIESLRTNIIPISPGDAPKVFDGYFSGEPPFREQKYRDDIPDAFIYEAAVRISEGDLDEVQAVCSDKELKKALVTQKCISIHDNLKGLLSSEVIVAVSNHLPVAKYWTDSIRNKVVTFMSKQDEALCDQIQIWAENELFSTSVTDGSIPSDGNEAYIHGVGLVENLNVEWNNVEEMGPGWILVPFCFDCEFVLDFCVNRADSFHVDDWVSISFPKDFESTHYYEASGYRSCTVSGLINLRFTHDDLQGDKIVIPEVEVEDIEIELSDLQGEFPEEL